VLRLPRSSNSSLRLTLSLLANLIRGHRFQEDFVVS
jgi:hypothetical protein